VTEQPTDDRAKARRELTATVLLCAAGALVQLLAAGRTWAKLRGAVSTTSYTGNHVAQAVRPLALLALAGAAALLATKRWGRIAVGIVIVAAGLGSAVAAAVAKAPHGSENLPAWRVVAIVAAAPVVLAGAAAAARGYRWSVMSARYDAPGARQRVQDPDVALWDALDRGDDPTG
jgi:Tryptophan-associated transmembrane protein (Trp_oprn_chp)